MKEKYLPLGTVVLLKEATKKLIITGYCSVLPENEEKVYDYLGSLFPEGNLAGDDIALFDHEQIEKICHMGLEDEEYINMNEQLRAAMIGGDSTTNQKEQVEGSQNSSVQNFVESKPVEGEPVLKLEPIYTPPAVSELTKL